jgi:hypothetical protein
VMFHIYFKSGFHFFVHGQALLHSKKIYLIDLGLPNVVRPIS